MALLQMLIQMVTDWVRGFLADILGRRAELVVDKWLKKQRRRKKSRRIGSMRNPCENKGK